MTTQAQKRKHDAFLAGRRRYIGGTDVAAILGLSRWSTPLQVWHDKTGEQRSDDGTLAMRRGLALEDFIADEFTRARPEYVTFKTRPIVRTDWGFPAGASVDRMVARSEHPRTPVGILEAKTAFRYGWRDWDEDAGDLPDDYYAQMQWYMAVCNLPVCWAVADVGDHDRLRIIKVMANPAVQDGAISAARRFWREHVETGIPPEPSGTQGDAEVLRDLYAQPVSEPPAELDESAAELVEQYLAAKAKAKDASLEAEAAKQKLCALMGEHETARTGRWTLAWKAQERKTVDTKALRSAHPEIASEFERVSTTRVFAEPKEDK